MRNSGTQFAPELVSAFLKGMFRELTGDAKDKRFRRLLGREFMEAEGIVPAVQDALNGADSRADLPLPPSNHHSARQPVFTFLRSLKTLQNNPRLVETSSPKRFSS